MLTNSHPVRVVAGLLVLILSGGSHFASPLVTSSLPADASLERDALRHDSRDPLFRQPPGAVPAGTTVVLRISTAAGDATSATMRVHDQVTETTRDIEMNRAASSVDCYHPGLEDTACDWWEAVVAPSAPTTLSYRFVVADGPVQAVYRDDGGWDGGLGEAGPHRAEDLTQCCFYDYAITVHDPDFQPIPWVRDAVIYQVFPDRFRNGDPSNDTTGAEPRYDWPPDPLSAPVPKEWDELPDGHCKAYVEGCSARAPRNRDYFGGDLRGVEQSLDYIAELGATTIYLNPIFASASNHGYDTRDYTRIEPFFGSHQDWESLVAAAEARGIRLMLDGVFVATSSDSPYFDRNQRWPGEGACEAEGSPYRGWYAFQPSPLGTCAGPLGTGDTMHYESWHGFDVLPLLNKHAPGVRDLVYGADDAVARRWLDAGASGWRIDSMLHESFPDDFWREFRTAVKDKDPEAPIIGELWHRGALLPKVRGDMADGAMNYRLRGAVLRLFGNLTLPADDAGRGASATRFANLLESTLEDQPPAATFNAMNLLESHDTERILWRLTPGLNGRVHKELDTAALEEGKKRLRLAVLAQMTMPGTPSVYYGTEIGLTGDQDPDNRRSFPWGGDGAPRTEADDDLRAWFQRTISMRSEHEVLRTGTLDVLHADDARLTTSYVRTDGDQRAIVVLNASADAARTVEVPIAGELRDGVVLDDILGSGSYTTSEGAVSVQLPAMSGAVLVPRSGQDLQPPSNPGGLRLTGAGEDVHLAWEQVPDAVAYRVYASPLTGAGYRLLSTVTATEAPAEGAEHDLHVVVRAVDAAGNEGGPSEEVRVVKGTGS